MPYNGSGSFSVVYTFVPGTTISSAQNNANNTDIATNGLSAVLTRDGQSVMTGQFKAALGSLGQPSITFTNDLNTGRYRKSADTMADVCGGTEIVEYSATGISVTGTVKQGGSVLIPAGLVFPYAGLSAPSGYLLCYGQAVSRTTYADLFTVIGTTYGAGDTSTTFNVPDLRGRALFGKDDMGGSAANRITNAGSGITGTTLGASGGAQNVTVVQGNLPNVTLATAIGSGQGAHAHTITDGYISSNGGTGATSGAGKNQVVAPASTASATLPAMTGTTPLGGSGTAVQSMNPALILNYIIKI